MSNYKVRALYSFSAEPNSAELSIQVGEELSVTRSDVGEGWLEGTNKVGKTGLFPAAYVETVPAAGANNNNKGSANQEFAAEDDWDWDGDEGEDYYAEIPANEGQIYANEPGQQDYPRPMVIHRRPDDDDTVSNMSSDTRGPVTKKNLSRFSTFAKTGGEDYILGTFNMPISEADKVFIRQNEDKYFWAPILQHYTVVVASPKKETKLKGLKSFIAYQLTPSFNNIQVSRRYKHFDWLHERLTDKYCLIPIPPLPDKQISGRYEEQFIEHRRVQLQEFVDWVCRHPILSYSSVWQHFLTCTDDKKWKAGKRQAEKDPLVGANYCLAIQAPEKSMQLSIVEAQMDKCANFIHHLSENVKNLFSIAQDQTKKEQVAYKREFLKIGDSFYSLGASLELDEGVTPSKLTSAVKQTGVTYRNLGKMYEEQPKLDWEPFGDKMHMYKGLTAAFPDVLAVHKTTQQKRKECEKMTSDQKMDMAQLMEVQRRTDVVSYAVLAEIQHFRTERSADLKNTMQSFLKQQIKFYEKIVVELQGALALYDDC